MTIATEQLTPMMQQWKECKEQALDAILFFRLGDFYEAFYEDAKTASRELDLTLTERQGVPMCGIPWHTADGYVERLVLKNYKVAIAEQVEDPKKAKGLVTRKLTRIVTPATLMSPALTDKGYSYFGSLAAREGRYGVALLDVAAASFLLFECNSPRELINELFRQGPKELLISHAFVAKEPKLFAEISENQKICLTRQEEWLFDPVQAEESLLHHFGVKTLDGFGLKEMVPAKSAAGALLQYVRDWLMCPLEHVKKLQPHTVSKTMQLDRQTVINLELLESASSKSLLSVLDETKTPMGGRLLRHWIKNPLIDKDEIVLRQKAIAAFLESEALDSKLECVRDLEKLIYRIKNSGGGPREYMALKNSLEPIPAIKSLLSHLQSELIAKLAKNVHALEECTKTIKHALVDNPPLRVTDGGLFKEGFCPKLDELVALRKNSHDWLIAYQTKLREDSGIKTLKVGFNRMFGYYIEVSRGQVDKMPSTFQRRQTLVNGERYISPELKEFEEKILTADASILEIEQELFVGLRKEVSAWHDAILETAKALGEIDVLRSLSIAAKRRNYACPNIDTARVLSIQEGRHPVIEALSLGEHFVPNDLFLDGNDAALLCLTGPNMAGKSTYIRQTALLVIMAQIGSYIPAKEATIGIVDKVFSRIGASDDLARGQSTFMVEMAETASILHQATDRSLVILDEIGRGTSTYDGISIAWAVAEFLLTKEHGRPKTLFATHYFELTELKTKLPGVVNATVAISETAEGIIFMRKVIPGTTDRSYGIHVARLAGMPEKVIKRAEALLAELEKKHTEEKSKPIQNDLFMNLPDSRRAKVQRQVINELLQLNLEKTSPIDAFLRLVEWQNIIK